MNLDPIAKGLEPNSGFWDSIHELRSSISLTSESQFCFLMSFDLGFLFFLFFFSFFLEVLAEEEELWVCSLQMGFEMGILGKCFKKCWNGNDSTRVLME